MEISKKKKNQYGTAVSEVIPEQDQYRMGTEKDT
jgi:hypothetical protein